MDLPDVDSAGHKGINGQHEPIFRAYSISKSDAKDSGRCQVIGYTLDTTKMCNGETTTTMYTSGEEVRKSIGKNVKTSENVQTLSFTVNEVDNVQFSHSISFGESLTSTQNSDNNHCVDEGVSDSITEGDSTSTSSSKESSDSFEVKLIIVQIDIFINQFVS